MNDVTRQQDVVTGPAAVSDGATANGHAPQLRPVGAVRLQFELQYPSIRQRLLASTQSLGTASRCY